ncbi:MAG: twin-arginine translocase subunit TatB [Geminicoccaceae bacterium]|nr:twin-arginine translocase subunit TatB [Geminicoccaceae bacterium]
MFDLGWSEMAVIMLVAIIVIGPKDLPRVARTVGKWTGKARAMARDFQRSLDDMAREAELDEIKKAVEKAGPNKLKGTITNALESAIDLDDRNSAGKQSPRVSSPGRAGDVNEGAGDKPAAGSPMAVAAAGAGDVADKDGPREDKSSGNAATTDGKP